MSKARVLTISSFVYAATLFAPRAIATTYVVDANGGGQFTDIPPAIAFAQPGDVLLVMHGSYSGFSLTKGLTIIGYDAPTVGAVFILGIPAGETAVVVNVQPPSLSIGGCMGPVVVQETGALEHIGIQQCTDVRLRKTQVFPLGPSTNGCDVDASRLELAQTSVIGGSVPQCVTSMPYPIGGIGLHAFQGSRVQIALANLSGGSGALCYGTTLQHGGNGGSAIDLGPGDEMIFSGGGSSNISGGAPGGDGSLTNCSNDGEAGSAVHNGGGTFEYSGLLIQCPLAYVGVHCIPIPDCGPGPIVGPATAVVPADPTLEFGGHPVHGNSVQFTLRAPPGSAASLYFGRNAIVVPDANASIEQLTEKLRVVDLGTVPASGSVMFTWPISSSVPPGTRMIAQAEVTLPHGSLRRTNSTPVIVR